MILLNKIIYLIMIIRTSMLPLRNPDFRGDQTLKVLLERSTTTCPSILSTLPEFKVTLYHILTSTYPQIQITPYMPGGDQHPLPVQLKEEILEEIEDYLLDPV